MKIHNVYPEAELHILRAANALPKYRDLSIEELLNSVQLRIQINEQFSANGVVLTNTTSTRLYNSGSSFRIPDSHQLPTHVSKALIFKVLQISDTVWKIFTNDLEFILHVLSNKSDSEVVYSVLDVNFKNSGVIKNNESPFKRHTLTLIDEYRSEQSDKKYESKYRFVVDILNYIDHVGYTNKFEFSEIEYDLPVAPKNPQAKLPTTKAEIGEDLQDFTPKRKLCLSDEPQAPKKRDKPLRNV